MRKAQRNLLIAVAMGVGTFTMTVPAASADPIDQCVTNNVGVPDTSSATDLNADPLGAQSCLPLETVTVNDGGVDTTPTMDSIDGAGARTGINFQHNYCDASYDWKLTSSHRHLLKADVQYKNFNGGPGTVTDTFTDHTGNSFGWSHNQSFSGGGGFSFAMFSAQVNQSTGDSVETTVTEDSSDAHPLNVPSGFYGNAQYRFYYDYADGDYTYTNQECAVKDYGNVRFKASYNEGWYAWTSKS